MKKQLMGLSIVAAMMFFTGCGSDDIADAIDDAINEDLYDGDYDYIVIYKNVSQEFVDYQESLYENYGYYEATEVSDNTDCGDFGFSSSNSYSYTNQSDGTGGTYNWYVKYNGGYCYEYDYGYYNNSYYNGNKDVAIVYNY